MGSVAVGLGGSVTLEAGARAGGSTLGAGAGSMGVGTLGDCSSVKVIRRGVAWKVGTGGGRERRAEAGQDSGVQMGLKVGDVVGKQIEGDGTTLGDSGKATHGHPGAGIQSCWIVGGAS
jgi:hypothetical protein